MCVVCVRYEKTDRTERTFRREKGVKVCVCVCVRVCVTSRHTGQDERFNGGGKKVRGACVCMYVCVVCV